MELRGKASPDHHSGSFAMSQMHLVPCFQAKTCTEQKASFCLKKKSLFSRYFQILAKQSLSSEEAHKRPISYRACPKDTAYPNFHMKYGKHWH